MFFHDRTDAGQRLVPLVEEYRDKPDTIVLGLPRGGVVVALEIAQALSLPMDVWVTRKIGAPLNPELAIGAVDTNGNTILDNNAVRLYEVSDRYIREEVEQLTAEIKRRYLAYRNSEEPPAVAGKTVLVVDDGVATGFTMLAAIESLRQNKAAGIICVVPVASPRVISQLQELADEVHCLASPSYFGSVGEFYRDFTQVSDDEVVACLQAAGTAAP
ncbi:MAG: phosphoribosyltransferase [Thermoleophilia bacterium]